MIKSISTTIAIILLAYTQQVICQMTKLGKLTFQKDEMRADMHVMEDGSFKTLSYNTTDDYFYFDDLQTPAYKEVYIRSYNSSGQYISTVKANLLKDPASKFQISYLGKAADSWMFLREIKVKSKLFNSYIIAVNEKGEVKETQFFQATDDPIAARDMYLNGSFISSISDDGSRTAIAFYRDQFLYGFLMDKNLDVIMQKKIDIGKDATRILSSVRSNANGELAICYGDHALEHKKLEVAVCTKTTHKIFSLVLPDSKAMDASIIDTKDGFQCLCFNVGKSLKNIALYQLSITGKKELHQIDVSYLKKNYNLFKSFNFGGTIIVLGNNSTSGDYNNYFLGGLACQIENSKIHFVQELDRTSKGAEDDMYCYFDNDNVTIIYSSNPGAKSISSVKDNIFLYQISLSKSNVGPTEIGIESAKKLTEFKLSKLSNFRIKNGKLYFVFYEEDGASFATVPLN